MKFSKCAKCGSWVGWINVSVSFILSALKMSMGIFTGSHALIALSLYSITDVISASIILISTKIASRPTDEEHPYGHGKVEFIAVTLESIILAITALIMAAFFINSIVGGGPGEAPSIKAMPIAVISIIACTLMYRYASCVGKHIGSFAIYTHAKHTKADAISSAAVFIAILIASFGFHIIDSIIAVFETCHIMMLAVEMFKVGLDGLMDSSAPVEKLEEIEEVVKSVNGVRGIDYIKARYIGSKLWIDVDVKVNKRNTVAQGEDILERVIRSVLLNIDNAGNVVVDFKPA